MRNSMFGLVLVAVLAACLFGASSASALTTINTSGVATPSDGRNAVPSRSGTWVKSAYGPFVVSANSQIHNVLNAVNAPCINCYLTDMMPSLEYGTSTGGPFGTGAPNGTVANLDTGGMMHHFLFLNPGPSKVDATCPGVGPGFYGERLFAAGNERTNVHLPTGFGYSQGTNGTNGWNMATHLVNRTGATQTYWVIMHWRHVPTADPVRPIWLDIAGMGNDCGLGEYTVPTGYSHEEQEWTVPAGINGRLVSITGHSHDLDITGPGSCAPPGHCPEKGGGIAVSAEVIGNSNNDYYGPSPPQGPCVNPPSNRCNRSLPAELTDATMCRSEAYYGTAFGGTQFAGHLDTMSLCGMFGSVPVGAQAQAYPPSGAWPSADGYRIGQGDEIRLHSEYQNDTGFSQTDAMGIMVAYLSPKENGYPRPKAATPTYLPLVHAYNACGSTNRQHGPTLAYPSCNPPTQTSGLLTSGNPPAQTANFVGSVKLVVVNGNDSTTADEADVNITVNITDVRNASDLTDYAGQVLASTIVQVTDRQNGPATGQSVALPVIVPCTTNGTAAVGSTCAVATTADAIAPGFIRETRRTIIELGQTRVFDGGPDGDPSITTDGPNTLFAVQGVLVP